MAPHPDPQSGALAFAYDLTLDESRRRAAVLDAVGSEWDPVRVLAGVLPQRMVHRVAD